jgi:hypothetical protein
VTEGIQTFESIYEKVKAATNPTQRDKLEENLKREIKKLQRFRDQIKSWAAGNEVKDKAPLLEQRKAIETVGLGPLCGGSEETGVESTTNEFRNSAWSNSRPSRRR